MLLCNSDFYPNVYNEMKFVQEEILKKYVCEQLLEHTVGVVGLSSALASTSSSSSSLFSSSSSGATRTTHISTQQLSMVPGIQLSVVRGRSGNIECSWDCAWTGPVTPASSTSSTSSTFSNSSNSSINSIHTREETQVVGGDLSRLQAAVALSNTVTGFQRALDTEEGQLLHAAKLIYTLRRALRDGDETGIMAVLKEGTQFAGIVGASTTTGTTKATPLWWPAIENELKVTKLGFESVRVSRDLCVGLDTTSPKIAELERAVQHSNAWLIQNNEAVHGRRQVERLTEAAGNILQLRHALLRNDDVAIEQCLDHERMVEPLVRREFDQARSDISIDCILEDLSASILTPPLATTRLESTLEKSNLLFRSVHQVMEPQTVNIANIASSTQAADTADTADTSDTADTAGGGAGGAANSSSRYLRHCVLHTLASHLLQLRRTIKMLDVRKLGKSDLHRAQRRVFFEN